VSAAAAAATPPSVGRGRTLAYASGNIGVEALGPILAWIPYLYAPPADAGTPALLPAATVGLLLFVGRFVDGFAEPIVGFLSDRSRTRFGRRIPWVVLGTPVLCAAFLGLFFPPFGPGRPLATAAWLCALNTVFWCAFTAVVAPYLALLPEIARTTEDRTRISALMTAFTVLTVVGANAALGSVVARFQGGGEALGIGFANGFEPQALFYAGLAAFFLYLGVAFVRERPAADPAGGHLSFRGAVVESLRNPAFLPLVAPMSVFLIGVNLIVTAVPYLGRAILGASEAEASFGTAIVYGAAAATLPFANRLVARFGKKRTYSASLLAIGVGFAAILVLAVAPRPVPVYYTLMALLGVPVGTLLVLGRVLIADVIDEDERRTGLRREAMYFGMQGLLTKVSFGVGPLLATQLFARFGNTAEEPLGILLCGPAASVLALAGWWAFRRYPL
jgi:GPH family glycoside/pentoside/hexuronide:cation symporter